MQAMCIWHHKMCNAKTGVGPTLQGQIKLNISLSISATSNKQPNSGPSQLDLALFGLG